MCEFVYLNFFYNFLQFFFYDSMYRHFSHYLQFIALRLVLGNYDLFQPYAAVLYKRYVVDLLPLDWEVYVQISLLEYVWYRGKNRGKIFMDYM